MSECVQVLIANRSVHGRKQDAPTSMSLIYCIPATSYYVGTRYLRTAPDRRRLDISPGESGRPRVATPEPACTRKPSAWPW